MDVVIGVDPSSRAMHAVVTVGQSLPEVFYTPLHKTDKPMAAAQAFQWIQSIVEQHSMDDVFVFLERPIMGRAGAHTMMVIAEANGAISAGATLAGAKVIYVNNQTWKKQVIGRGNCGKPDIKKWCREAWPAAYKLAGGTQDLYDAAGINAFGQHILGLRKKRTTKRKAVRRNG